MRERTDNPFAAHRRNPALLTAMGTRAGVAHSWSSAAARVGAPKCAPLRRCWCRSRVRHAPCSLHERPATLRRDPGHRRPERIETRGAANAHRSRQSGTAILERAGRALDRARGLRRRAGSPRLRRARGTPPTAAAALASVFPLGAARALAQDQARAAGEERPQGRLHPDHLPDADHHGRAHGPSIKARAQRAGGRRPRRGPMIRDLSINGRDGRHAHASRRCRSRSRSASARRSVP